MSSSSHPPGAGREPHWFIIVIVGLVLGAIVALVISMQGLNDIRFPWTKRSMQPTTAPTSQFPSSGPSSSQSPRPGGLTAPVVVTRRDGGGVDITWSVAKVKDLHSYSVYVTAVTPVHYTYSVPRYRGDSEVFERHDPVEYLNGLLAERKDSRRVEAGQVWYVCVQGMKDTPLNTPIDDYIIPGTKACSDNFTLP